MKIHQRNYSGIDLIISYSTTKNKVRTKTKDKKRFLFLGIFLSVCRTKIIFLFVGKLPKIKIVNRYKGTFKNALHALRPAGLNSAASVWYLQSLSQKNFFAKAEFKNFISEKEKKRKTKIKKIHGKGCDFCQNVLLIREYCLSLHGTFNNFHIILNFVFCIHTAVVVRCWRFFFMCACACACVRVRKQKMVGVDGFRVDVAV